MPILVVLHALLQDSPYILVGSLNYSISLRTVEEGFVVLNIKLLEQYLCFSLEMQPIVRDNFVWYSISADDVGLNKLGNFLRVQNLVWGSFHSFSEVINSNQYRFMAIGCCSVNLPNNIYSSRREWLGWSHGMQWHTWHVLQISMDLPLIALLNMSCAVWFVIFRDNHVSLFFMTTCVHSCMANKLTHEPFQLFVMLPWWSHKGDEFRHMIFCKASHHK